VLRADAFEVLGYFSEGFVPTHAFPTILSAAHGMFEPIFVVMEVLQGDGLWTDVTAAERIIFVAADVEALVAGYRDLDPADRFAKIAGAIMD
jgi:hypothetical protein